MTPQERGRLGGLATAQKYGNTYMREIAQHGFNALADKTGSPYAAVKYLQKNSKWKYIAGKKIGGDHYTEYHERG